MKKLFLLLLMSVMTLSAFNQPRYQAAEAPVFPERMNNPNLVNRFYEMRGNNFFWFADAEESYQLREKLKSMLDSAILLGLDRQVYHYNWITSNLSASILAKDSSTLLSADKIFTDAAIGFFKGVYQGEGVESYIKYDEISPKYEVLDNAFILGCLTGVTSAIELECLLFFLEPSSFDYLRIKEELKRKVHIMDQVAVKQLSLSINMLRWIKHFGFEQYIVVNPASAYLKYFVQDTVSMIMKVVVGKQSTPTPLFSAYCNSVILYPYWHVPRSIAVNELLPSIKRNPGYIDSRNLQLLDSKGKIVDPYSVNWSAVTAKNFSYQLRQSTGCDNALGVIKFNISDPYSVYMHDTNNKTAFLAGARYFSHGCIRLESPLALANALLPDKIDNTFLEACERNQTPKTLLLDEPIPVFVVYMPVEHYYDEVVKYCKDVYKIVR